nr:MAG: alpha/beta hydrolase [bacterium]
MTRRRNNGRAGGPGRQGHGESECRGPSSSARARLWWAMQRLLALGGVEAESREVEAAGTRLHYLAAGARGPTVVLLQGASGGAANWYRVLGPLSRKCRVLALDLPGFGFSAPASPVGPLGEYVAGVVDDWLVRVGVERYALVGTSFGGLVALRLAQRRPERVERLVLLDAAGLGRELPGLVRLAGLPLLGPAVLKPSRPGTRWLLDHVLTSRPLPREHAAALVDYLFWSARTGDARLLAAAVARFCDLGGQREVLGDEELAALHAPTLVVWGAEDRFLPAAHGERAAALIPRSAFVRIRGAGHSPNWEAPEELLAALVPFVAEG